jgi:hypothetical protein
LKKAVGLRTTVCVCDCLHEVQSQQMMRSRASLGRMCTFAQSKDYDLPRNTDDLLVCGPVAHDCGTQRESRMPQQAMAKAFDRPTAPPCIAE